MNNSANILKWYPFRENAKVLEIYDTTSILEKIKKNFELEQQSIQDLQIQGTYDYITLIGTFEYAYKKDSGKIAIYGIEMLVLALCMLAAIYIDIMLNSKFVIIAILTTYAIAIYYTVKSIIVYTKMKRQYFIDSMKKIIKK